MDTYMYDRGRLFTKLFRSGFPSFSMVMILAERTASRNGDLLSRLVEGLTTWFTDQ